MKFLVQWTKTARDCERDYNFYFYSEKVHYDFPFPEWNTNIIKIKD